MKTSPSSVAADRRAGVRLAFNGGARILREGAYHLTNDQRIERWRRLHNMSQRKGAHRGRA